VEPSGTGDPGEGAPKSARKSIPKFFGTLPGIITALAALITAIGGAFFGGTQVGTGPGPTVTVTAPSGEGSLPAQSGVPTGSVSAPADAVGLSTLTPITGWALVTKGSRHFGTTTYENSVTISCSGSLTYDVVGSKALDAIVGIDNDSADGADASVTVQFIGDDIHLGGATVSIDHPQPIHVPLQGKSQLVISCTSTGSGSLDPEVTLGAPSLEPA
jgi:hypothetical protein